MIFALIVLLAYPNGVVKEYRLGHDMTLAQCQQAVAKAEVQLHASLSVARVASVECRKEIEV